MILLKLAGAYICVIGVACAAVGLTDSWTSGWFWFLLVVDLLGLISWSILVIAEAHK